MSQKRDPERIAEQYENGATMRQLTKEYRMGESTLRSILREQGVSQRPAGDQRISSEAEAEIVRRYEAGEAKHAIARDIGCGRTTVTRVLNRHSVASRPSKHGQRYEIDRADLEQRYAEGWTLDELAHRYGCDRQTVRNWIERWGIEARTKTESFTRHRNFRDFSGDIVEKGYMLGFAKGDLYRVRRYPGGATVEVSCGSTISDQIDLIHSLFHSYGDFNERQIYRLGQLYEYVRYRLNLSFEFLLDYDDCIPDDILNHDEAFWAFLAGYIDAEGSIMPPGGKTWPQIVVRSTDQGIIQQCYEQLCEDGVRLPEPYVEVKAGTKVHPGNGRGLLHDYWGIRIMRVDSLRRALDRLRPHLRHASKVERARRVHAWAQTNEHRAHPWVTRTRG